jgi:hypothetical protein
MRILKIIKTLLKVILGMFSIIAITVLLADIDYDSAFTYGKWSFSLWIIYCYIEHLITDK